MKHFVWVILLSLLLIIYPVNGKRVQYRRSLIQSRGHAIALEKTGFQPLAPGGPPQAAVLTANQVDSSDATGINPNPTSSTPDSVAPIPESSGSEDRAAVVLAGNYPSGEPPVSISLSSGMPFEIKPPLQAPDSAFYPIQVPPQAPLLQAQNTFLPPQQYNPVQSQVQTPQSASQNRHLANKESNVDVDATRNAGNTGSVSNAAFLDPPRPMSDNPEIIPSPVLAQQPSEVVIVFSPLTQSLPAPGISSQNDKTLGYPPEIQQYIPGSEYPAEATVAPPPAQISAPVPIANPMAPIAAEANNTPQKLVSPSQFPTPVSAAWNPNNNNNLPTQPSLNQYASSAVLTNNAYATNQARPSLTTPLKGTFSSVASTGTVPQVTIGKMVVLFILLLSQHI
ncbi:uncharacterized protein VTP21DRAFT_5165 [Calcarisporiella thermophila]|uniref:uncharacterized protein n=1 Tax=Calcarisporiella thermophila TaxID=911321 RepID=UPI0037429F8B